MKYCLLSFFLLLFISNTAQEDLTTQLYETYENYKEDALDKRRIKPYQVQLLVNELKKNKKFTVTKVGESIQGRDLNLISIGKGSIDVFLWSQMHGDEPTATQAIFDIFNFLNSDDFTKEKREILARVKLHFLPMLNPDGAQLFTRRNALGIDINRDALRLQSPEGRTLKKVRDSLNPKFGFNLHDQSRYYNAERTAKPATISYLAPPFNYEKEINTIRGDAMKVIVFMNNIIQKYAPGQVGRYSDDFEPRAFGDNLTKWGTGVILIESGGYQNDREKQEIRKLNYVSILSALYTIGKNTYKDIPIEDYEKIPHNDRKMFDLKLTNVTYHIDSIPYQLDLGIFRNEVDDRNHDKFHYESIVADQGDLSTYYGYETFDASGYTLVAPKVTEQIIKLPVNFEMVTDYEDFVTSGFAYLRANGIKEAKPFQKSRINLVPENFELPEFNLRPGITPNFFLKKNGKYTHAIINGFLLDLSKPLNAQEFGNALIYK